MKAIQIKYLGATNTKGARLKAWTEAGSLTVSRDFALSPYEQANALAAEYLAEHNWPCDVAGFGTLPNGDYVATLSRIF